MIGPKTFEEVIRGSESLGALSATAVWALWAALMVAYTVWRERKYFNAETERNTISQASAETRFIQAQALSKLSDDVNQMKMTINQLSIIVSERLRSN